MRLAYSRKGLPPPAWVQDDLYSTHTEGHQGIQDNKYFELVEPFHRELSGRGKVNSINSSSHFATYLLGDSGHSLPLHKTFVSLSGQREDSAKVRE